MATFTTPQTWTDGSTPGATDLNREIRDNILSLAKLPMVDVYRSSDQTGLSTGADTLVNWSAVNQLDNLSMWSGGSPSKLTVQAGWAGIYKVHSVISFSGGSGTTVATQYAYIRKNGSSIMHTSYTATVGGAGQFSVHLTKNLLMAVGDYVEIMARANATIGATTVTSNGVGSVFEMEFVGFQ